VGFKPARDTYPTLGVFPLSPTLDHVGLLTRSVADLAAVHAMLGHPFTGPRRPDRLGVLRQDLAGCDPVVRNALQAAIWRLEGSGCDIVEVDWPDPEDVFAVSTAILFAEAAAIHRGEMRRDSSRYGEDVRARLVLGAAIPATAYVAAKQVRERLRAQVRQTLAAVDSVIGPTVGIVAPTLERASDPAVSGRLVAYTRLANVAGVPAVSLPIPGCDLPVGLQITGLTNEQVLAVAGWLEAELESRLQDAPPAP
jgi:aspartyl-tRNA(Asn)/glutamyl-tRNA(Gln) amidotransferase subunit A